MLGCSAAPVLLARFDQPLTLVVLSAALSGVVMFIYSGLLIAINRKFLPAPLKIRGVPARRDGVVDRPVRRPPR